MFYLNSLKTTFIDVDLSETIDLVTNDLPLESRFRFTMIPLN